MLRFKRVHDSGTDTFIIQEENTWQVQINLHEPNRNPGTIMGYRVPTMHGAKSIADNEVSKYGHVCNGVCQNWIEVP